MPLHRVKSRVRFQGLGKKAKQGGGGKAQHKSTRTVFDATPRPPLFGDMVDENLFKKKRVPSTGELADLLKSNLSSSLAAEKAYLEQQKAQYSSPSPVCQHVEQVQEGDTDPPGSLLELAPLVYANRDMHDMTDSANVMNNRNYAHEGPSASLLAATAIYVPLNGRREQGKSPRASSTTSRRDTRPLFHGYAEEASAAGSCAIEDDDGDDAVRPQSSASISIQKVQSALLKRVVTLFAGRHRRRATSKDLHNKAGDDQKSTTPLSSPPQPSIGSPCCSIYSDEATVPSASSSPPPPRPGLSYLARANAPLNLPVSPPIVVPKGQRPYRPSEERLDQPAIKPAPAHKLFGTYHVAPDIFTPEEVQQGFPGVPTTRTRLPPNEARFLDRTNTAWGNWYARHPNPEDLPFATAYKGADEPTDQEVWDTQVAAHAQFRKAVPPPTSEEELRQRLDDEEHERAERLRYPTGHCFGALTGFCYPFQSGRII
ncbi:hypothetical protein N0V86_004314 [Didymella sp. IMI 355093]|nr:hypothetical protein N0V86_004314 [Didymella sp. IMI 355093]